MGLSIQITGLDATIATLQKLASSTNGQVATALRDEAEIQMTEAKRRTPVDTGVLRASGFVRPPVITTQDVSVDLVFGGAASDYAIYVHENLQANHPVGQAKFLESVVTERAKDLPKRVADRIDLGKGIR